MDFPGGNITNIRVIVSDYVALLGSYLITFLRMGFPVSTGEFIRKSRVSQIIPQRLQTMVTQSSSISVASRILSFDYGIWTAWHHAILDDLAYGSFLRLRISTIWPLYA